MRYVYMQLTRELKNNWIFLCFMVLISGFTSFMYYFVRYSIDGNWEVLRKTPVLTENQLEFRNALISNGILARNGLGVFILLGILVFVMFFYRFIKSEGRQLGCLKALGFSDRMLIGYFIALTVIISAAGGLLGVAGGYLCADILMDAYEKSYLVSGLVKSIGMRTFLIGFLLPMAAFSFCAYITCGLFAGKEASLLITGARGGRKQSLALSMADHVSHLFPESLRLPVRLALRKSVALGFLILSVGCFFVMFVMAYSLNLSSGKVYRSQTEGRNYQYDTLFDEVQTGGVFSEGSGDEVELYLMASGMLVHKGREIPQDIVGIEPSYGFFELMDLSGNKISYPLSNFAVISEGLGELYGIKAGDVLTVRLGSKEAEVSVSDIAFNGSVNCIYLSKPLLQSLLSVPKGAYNGGWSNNPMSGGDHVTTKQERAEILERGAGSNRTSAVINQVIGCVVGIFFLYLALLMNFMDCRKDFLILDQMGYEAKEIEKLLIDIYRPVICIAFLIIIWPGIELVKFILRSLSIQIHDYIPFQTNVFMIIVVFIVLNVVYCLVQLSFGRAVKRLVR